MPLASSRAASLRCASWRSAITTPPTMNAGFSAAMRMARDSGSA
jgi:hypothetical protein